MHNRFFCPKENISNREVLITDKKEIHHIVNVLKFGVGSKIVIFDGEGEEIEGSIRNISKKEIAINILKKNELKKRPIEITLVCAIPKKSRFDFIVEKTTELGVEKIIPLESERTEVRFSKERIDSKIKHWRQIAINASKQSQSSFVPQVENIMPFEKVLSKIKKYDLAIIPTLFGKRISIVNVLRNFKGKKIAVFIGPEGDFTQRELMLATNSGCRPVTLGASVLKVDTAAISIIAILNYVLGAEK